MKRQLRRSARLAAKRKRQEEIENTCDDDIREPSKKKMKSIRNDPQTMLYLSVKCLELVCCGYVHEHYDRDLPIVLTRVIQLFYDPYYRWHIKKGKAMKKFLEAKTHEAIYAKKTLSFQDIVFKFSLCPNGWNNDEVGQCLYFIETVSFPKDIEYLVMYLELIEERTNTIIKRIRKLKHVQDTTGWGINRKHILLLKEVKPFPSLYFDALIDIKHIQYRQGTNTTQPREWKTVNKVSKTCTFDWNMGEETIRTIKGMRQGKCLWSPNFDGGNWCLELFGSGYKHRNDLRNFVIHLNCLYFPFGIQSLKVKFKASSEDIRFVKRGYTTEIFTFSRGCDSKVIPNQGFEEELEDMDMPISMNVTLEIQEMIDDTGHTIPADQWSEYGVQ